MNIYKVPDHQNHKQKLLDLIASIPETPLRGYETVDKISHTDWSLRKTRPREYWNYFKKNIFEEYGQHLCKTFNWDILRVTNGWFQQYSKNDFHGWHIHDNVRYASVYYVELPLKTMRTEFKDPETKSLHSIEVEEGDILTFPAQISHRSKPFKGKKRKTVIAFNIK